MPLLVYFVLAVLLIALITLSVLYSKSTNRIKGLERKLVDVKRRKESITETFERLMDHSSDFIFRYNKDGLITYASSNVERVLGYTDEDNPMHFRDVLTKNPVNNRMGQYLVDRFRDDLQLKTPYFIEVFDKSRQTHMLEVFEFPFSNADAKVEYVTCIARNMTGIYKAELELKESERLQSMILKAIPDALFTMDRKARFVDYQMQREDELWFKPSDFIGKKPLEIVPEPLGTIFEEAIHRAFETDELQTLEYVFGKPGREENFEGRIIKLDESKVLVISRNITAQKRLEVELRKAKEAAESAAKAKSNFLATMSHEIRTPMNGVIGMTSLLSETQLSDDQRDYVETIQASGDTLLRVINDILDYSKIESGKMTFEESVFSLEKVIDDSLGLIQFEAQKKGLALNKHIAEDVPPFVKTDRGRLRQILLNLLSNAVKFTERGSVSLKVDLESKTARYVRLIFSIKDTGIGIPQDKLKGLFQEFTQVDSSHSRKFGGTGLGLAIVKRLVRLMNGKVSVKSKVGLGSEFSFTARVKLASEKKLAASEFSEEQMADMSDQLISNEFPLKVLLAEDNLVNRKLTTIFLERLGFVPDVAQDGLEVITLTKKKKYDVILLDISMPEMDGYQATEIIKKMDLKLAPYIIGVSANAFQGDIDKALSAGMDDYLTKPIRFEELRNKLITAGRRRFPFVS